METKTQLSPAEIAAKQAFQEILEYINSNTSFLLEAGAGAGKTYSLIQILRHLIDTRGIELIQRKQQIACITYTNVARKEIESRTDSHPAIFSSTIHGFCWSLIKDFQPTLRQLLPGISKWDERIEEFGKISTQKIIYDLGYPKIDDEKISLHHNDVVHLIAKLLEYPKFRKVFISKYPILFIDEYQDSEKQFAESISKYFLGAELSPLIGFFGDHWQMIYEGVCGKIDHTALKYIGKQSNFRSVKKIVDALNRMRPELQQEVSNPKEQGAIQVFHTNNWVGERRSGQGGGHWKGDLPEKDARLFLQATKQNLRDQGWNLAPEKTKILMLTHNVLATEQGYSNLAKVFSRNEDYVKKEDAYMEFLLDVLEPACNAYEMKRFGEMFQILRGKTARLNSPDEKRKWVEDLDSLIKLKDKATIGEVIDHLKSTGRPRLSQSILRIEKDIEKYNNDPESEIETNVNKYSKLRQVIYSEVAALEQFINKKTPFSTQHGVKGAEFENVLVVIGRGWNKYNFGQMLEWAEIGIPSGKDSSFVRNRNLFYVACSRPKKRLAILFTQELSPAALTTLSKWFDSENVQNFPI